MNLDKLAMVISKYVAFAVALTAGWAAPVIKAAHVWGDVFSQGNTLALAGVLIVWAGACALHYALTGDPNPVPAAAASPPPAAPAQPAVPPAPPAAPMPPAGPVAPRYPFQQGGTTAASNVTVPEAPSFSGQSG